MSATHATDSTTTTAPVLCLALELSWNSWKLAFTVGAGQKPGLRSIAAHDSGALMLEIDKAKHRFRLPEKAPVLSCYEAGRDGFWLHRYLLQGTFRAQVTHDDPVGVPKSIIACCQSHGPLRSTVPP